MRVYVAGRRSDKSLVRGVQEILIAAGHEITFDWTGPNGERRDDWSDVPDRARELSTRERHAVRSADMLVLVGSEPHGGLGCFIETGMALALGIPVLVVGLVRESVFWYLPIVERLESIYALNDWLMVEQEVARWCSWHM
jgi:hypothetical protein